MLQIKPFHIRPLRGRIPAPHPPRLRLGLLTLSPFRANHGSINDISNTRIRFASLLSQLEQIGHSAIPI